MAYPEPTSPAWVGQEDPVLMEELGQRFERMARGILDTEVEKARTAAATVAQAHLIPIQIIEVTTH